MIIRLLTGVFQRPNLFLLILLTGLLGCTPAPSNLAREDVNIPPDSRIQSIPEWPPLPITGFIKDRAASEKDVDDGNAVFVAADSDGTVIGKPLSIEIPQYAFWNDEESAKRYRVIIIQAELARGYDMIGYKNIDTGEFGAGLRQEFDLLGKTPPPTASSVP